MNSYKYEHRQLSTELRHKNNISAHKILNIEDNYLIVHLWCNKCETERISVPTPEEYKTGEYIDLVVLRMSKTSWRVELIGHTPQEFIPADDVNIGF